MKVKFWGEYIIWEITKKIHKKNSTTKFKFDSFKISDQSTISKMIITYNFSSLSANASSPVTSVTLVVIWGNLEVRILKTWTVIFLSCQNFIIFIRLSLFQGEDSTYQMNQ